MVWRLLQRSSVTPRAWSRVVMIYTMAAVFCLASGARADQDTLTIELNKLKSQGTQCRAYFVINNKKNTSYQQLKLDLVLFHPDGVIGSRFAVDLGPLKANKRMVKLFELTDTPCDQVGSFLINDVVECKTESGPLSNCLDEISVSSLASAKLTK